MAHNSYSSFSLFEQFGPNPSDEVEQGKCPHKLGWPCVKRVHVKK